MEQGYIVMTELNGYKNLYMDRGVVYVYQCRSDAEKAKQEADATGRWDYVYILDVLID